MCTQDNNGNLGIIFSLLERTQSYFTFTNLQIKTNFVNTCTHRKHTDERFSSAKMSRAYDRTHRTFTLLSVRIKVMFGYRGGTYCYSSLCSPVHLHHQPTTSSPAILSTTHTQLEYQLQQPGNATSPPERPLEVYGAWGQRLPSG